MLDVEAAMFDRRLVGLHGDQSGLQVYFLLRSCTESVVTHLIQHIACELTHAGLRASDSPATYTWSVCGAEQWL